MGFGPKESTELVADSMLAGYKVQSAIKRRETRNYPVWFTGKIGYVVHRTRGNSRHSCIGYRLPDLQKCRGMEK